MEKRFCMLILFLLPLIVTAQSIVLNDLSNPSIGAGNLLVYKSEANISIDSALNATFHQPDSDIPNLGLSRGQAWVKLTVENASGQVNQLLKLANPNYDEVVVYRFLPDMELEEKLVISKQRPFDNRKYQDPNFLFDLNVPPGEQRLFYISIKCRAP